MDCNEGQSEKWLNRNNISEFVFAVALQQTMKVIGSLSVWKQWNFTKQTEFSVFEKNLFDFIILPPYLLDILFTSDF